ncbi:MAG: hypothetical protein AAGI48_12285 [Verrucomicrobiota bacterium]
MKLPLIQLFATAAAVALTSCATQKAKDKDAPSGPPSATIKFTGGSAAYWASAQGGSGTLYFRGKEYPFTAVALGAGGTGAQHATTEGEVYNLNSLSDFAGTYTQLSSGFTIIRGKKNTKLTNDKGVVIYAVAKTTGVASSTGGTKVLVELK